MAIVNTQTSAKTLATYCHRLYERSLVGGTEGNVSIRLSGAKVLITPRNKNKGYLRPQDMITISMTGRVITGEEQPSTEYQLHLEIYEKRPDVQAICHAHPLYATGFAVAGLPLDKLVLPEIISSLGIIPISEYGMPGTAEIAQKIRGQIINHDAILMKNHGALTVGKDLEEAFNRMEMVERYAEIMFAAMLIGKPQPLSLSLAKKLPGFDRVKRQIRRTEPTRDNRIK